MRRLNLSAIGWPTASPDAVAHSRIRVRERRTLLLAGMGITHRRGPLRRVAEQCVDLRLDRLFYRLGMVGFVCGPQEHGRRTVRGDALAGEEQRITSRNDTVEGGGARHPMVRMELVALPRVVGQEDIGGCKPDLAAHLLAQGHRHFELPVDVTEMNDRCRPESSRSGGLLRASPRRQIGRRDVRVPGSLRAVGDDEHRHVTPRGRPPRQGAARAELDVVWMGADGERTAGRGERLGRVSHVAVEIAGHGLRLGACAATWVPGPSSLRSHDPAGTARATLRSATVSRSRARPLRTTIVALGRLRRWR